MACSFTIEEIYKETGPQYIMYVIFALTVAVFAFGLYNIILVRRKHGQFTNMLLKLFYAFAQITLFLRICLYVFIIVIHSVGTSPYCKLSVLAFTLQDLPDYMFLISGLCQLFILV